MVWHFDCWMSFNSLKFGAIFMHLRPGTCFCLRPNSPLKLEPNRFPLRSCSERTSLPSIASWTRPSSTSCSGSSSAIRLASHSDSLPPFPGSRVHFSPAAMSPNIRSRTPARSGQNAAISRRISTRNIGHTRMSLQKSCAIGASGRSKSKC